jgi:TolA-binding protein
MKMNMQTRIIGTGLFLAAVLAPSAVRAASAKDLVGSADGFYLQKEYEFAAEEYARFLAKFPTHEEAPRARFQLGQSYYELKQYDKAAAAYEGLVAKDPPESLLAKGLYRLGECRSKQKEWKKAAEAYGRLVTKLPKHRLAPGALWGRAEALYNLEEYRDAAAAYEKLIKDYGKNEKYVPLAWYSLGWARFEQKDFAGAARAFETVVAKYPKGRTAAQSQLKVGECCLERKDYAKALAAYRKVLDTYPGEWSDEARMGIGDALFARKEYVEAAKAFEEVAEKHPKEPDAPLALLNAANAYLAADRAKDALAAADRFDAAYGKTAAAPRVAHARARALLKLERYHEAARTFTGALRADLPKVEQAAAWFGLGEALFGAEKFGDALKAYQKVVSDFPGHDLAEDAAYSMVFCHAELGKLAQAVAQCRRFEKTYPKSRLLASVKQVQGEYLYRQKDYAAARKASEASLRLDADGPYADDALYKLAWSCRQLDDHARAEQHALKLPTSFPKSPYAAEALYLAGLSAVDRKDEEAAVRHFDSCQKTFPKSSFAANAAYQIALLAYRKRDFQTAAKHFDTFLIKYPKSNLVPQALVYAGESAFQLERYDAAQKLYERQLADYPEKGKEWADVARHGVAWCLRKKRKPAEAAEAFQQVVKQHPRSPLAPDSAFWAAKCLEDAGKHAAAAAAFRRFAKAHPKHALAEESAFRVASALLGAREYDEALRAYGAFVQSNPKSEFADNAVYDSAWCHKHQKQPDEARKAYERLLAEYPKSDVRGNALFELGNLLFDAKEYKEAVARFDAAAEKKPEGLLDRVYYMLGLTYARQGAHEQAAVTFGKLIRECGDSEYVAEAHYRFARARQQQEKFSDAVRSFQKALDARPRDELVELSMFYLAECLRAQEDWAKALAAYKAVLAKFPKSESRAEMLYGQGLCAQKLGAYTDAVEAYKAVIEATETVTAARAQYGVAECHMLQGEYKEAMREFLRIEIWYGYDEWRAAGLFMAGQCAEKLKDPARARKYYQKVLDNVKYRATSYEAKCKTALEGL